MTYSYSNRNYKQPNNENYTNISPDNSPQRKEGRKKGEEGRKEETLKQNY
jgi:hypothetical protein